MERKIESLISGHLAAARNAARNGYLPSVDKAIRRCLRDMKTILEPLSSNEGANEMPEQIGWQGLGENREKVRVAQRLCQEAGDYLPDLVLAETKIDQAITFWNEHKKLNGKLVARARSTSEIPVALAGGLTHLENSSGGSGTQEHNPKEFKNISKMRSTRMGGRKIK